MQKSQRRQRLEEFEERCRRDDLAVTVQRRAIFEMVLQREDHPTADQVFEDVQGRIPQVSRTTVYRVLDTLVQLGVLTKICHPGAGARFDPKTHRHHHLVCLDCDKVIDLEDESLDALPLPPVRRRGFEVTDFSVHIRGRCAECRRKAGSVEKGGKTTEKRARQAARRKKGPQRK